MFQRRNAPSGPLDIALIGTRGVPAHYGGFETCVEEVGARLAGRGHKVTVYCRNQDGVERAPEYRGMHLVHLPAMRRRSLETLSHTGLSVAHQVFHAADAAVVFNCANAPWLPLLRMRGIPVATHVDGLEWKRAKWGGNGRRYYQMAEKLSVRWSDALIADAQGIADYYRETHHADTDLITYGAPVVAQRSDRLAELGLERDGFHLVVARFEPENHVAEIVQGYTRSAATKPLIVVGSAPYAHEYTKRVHELGDRRVHFLGGVWDQELLDQLYAGATSYLHGHSVGGTNPSLLRAIGAGTATNAFDVVFNREVLRESGRYFSTADELSRLIERTENRPAETAQRGSQALDRARSYDWETVTDGYEALCHRLAGVPMPALAVRAA
ncbi:DUF1972 domain-containing protein [Nakamurella sp. YIM 132087]|uniref:DUF1972 domain-containing protein n=1 Tax=Nakamurella alba TaxID=2665158 RepID=A0A7K1FF45_9ACTN|nr:DUF1972 domain-containing protein [Nakamurella alba]MTD12741.1 DUF1972 domain-containing protein [Nakamurella alba]